MKRLLIVDDHEENLCLLQVLLERRGFGVELAHDGAEALAKARQDPPDLIVSDILMPVMDGFTLCRNWKADDRLSRVPFVFYTATYTDPRDERLALDLGADAFLTKPTEPEDFMSAILAVLARAETGELVPLPGPDIEDMDVLKQYSEALVRKLEDKMLQLEKANQALERETVERKRAEESLRLTQFSVDHAADSVFWTDSAGRLLRVSDSTCRSLAYEREELLAMTLFDLDPALSPERWSENWERVKEEGSFAFETAYRTKDGKIFPVDASVNYVAFEDRELNCVFARDVTERKLAEQERLQLEREVQRSQRLESLGVLAGGIAHDFNNILLAVLGNAELALAELSPSAPARENLLEITQASHRAADLCRQMLAYSGRGHFACELIDLRALVEDMLHLVKSAISKKILLNLNLEKGLPPLRGDPSQLSQVVMNLVINASEAIGEDSGVIAISTGAMECSADYLRTTYADANLAPGLYLTLEVSDTGFGMDGETQSRLFEPFFTTKFTGRGLGLAAVLGIVRGHKGALRLYSELGKGTTFKLLFPAAEVGAGPLAKKNAADEDDWRGQGAILLVDDEETIRALGTRMLSRLGFRVHLAADGREALEVYSQHLGEIDLVLLDLTMPSMNGEETFRELRRLDPAVRVIMSSGYTENDITSRFAGKGLAGFIHKPYTLAMLRDGLRAALEGTEPGSGTV